MQKKNTTLRRKRRYLCNDECLAWKELEERLTMPVFEGHEYIVDNYLKQHYEKVKEKNS